MMGCMELQIKDIFQQLVPIARCNFLRNGSTDFDCIDTILVPH